MFREDEGWGRSVEKGVVAQLEDEDIPLVMVASGTVWIDAFSPMLVR